MPSTANSQNVLGSLSSLASGGTAGGVGDLVNKFLPLVFGSSQGQVTSAISQQSGLGGAAVSGLFKLAVPLVLGFLGRAHANGTLNAGSLGSMLKAEAPSLQSYLPAGVLGSLGAAAGGAVSAVQTGASAAASGASRWIVPLAILGALVLVWLLMRSMHGPKEVAQSRSEYHDQAATAIGNAANSAWAALGEMVAVKLPDGTDAERADTRGGEPPGHLPQRRHGGGHGRDAGSTSTGCCLIPARRPCNRSPRSRSATSPPSSRPTPRRRCASAATPTTPATRRRT